MALRRLTTRMWGPAAAYALRPHPVGPGAPPPPSPAAALSRFLGTTRGQNDIAVRRTSIDIQRTSIDYSRIRDDVKRLKIEDEVMREDLRWATRYYKTLEWSCYFVLSVSTAAVIACEVIVRSRQDKGHVRPT